MKKIITIALAIYMVMPCTAQKPSSDYYMQRSKRQESTGNILLGGGAVITIPGLVAGGRKQESTFFDSPADRAILPGLGVVTMLGSIPFYIAGAKNQKRAARLGVGTGRINPSPMGTTSRRYLSVGMRIPI